MRCVVGLSIVAKHRPHFFCDTSLRRGFKRFVSKPYSRERESMFRKLQDVSLSDTLKIIVEGEEVGACEGETVAGVLLRRAPLLMRSTPVSGASRAPYCMMGVCFECLAVVDGIPSVQTCLTIVRAGMRVERQCGRREVVFEGDSSFDVALNGDRERSLPTTGEGPRNEKRI
jgi:D-hydroxyproline dehydrogenase subunit gamma